MLDNYIGVHDVWKLLERNGIYIGDCRIRQLMKSGAFGPMCINSGEFPGRPVHLVSESAVEEYIAHRKEAGNKKRYKVCTTIKNNAMASNDEAKKLIITIRNALDKLEKLLEENQA